MIEGSLALSDFVDVGYSRPHTAGRSDIGPAGGKERPPGLGKDRGANCVSTVGPLQRPLLWSRGVYFCKLEI